jgi:arylsulfatase A-like enzyme
MRASSATTLLLLALTAVVASPGPSIGARAEPQLPSRPNFLIIVSDDQAYSAFSQTLMPTVYSELIGKGVDFTRGYDETSLCCPSRAQILTGLLEHDTGVDDNNVKLNRPTIVQALHDRGYHTMLAGKYLNSMPCDPRPEFDRWVCAANTPTGYSLKDPALNVDGTVTYFTGYETDILASLVTDFIAATPADQPFFVLYTPTTPHLPANDFRYSSLPIDPYRPPSYDEDTLASGKPQYMQRGPLTAGEIQMNDTWYRTMSHAVRSLDDSVATILNALGDRAENTVVVYLSDNGYLYGEHRRWAKQVVYEEAVHVPFIVRAPALVPETTPFTSDALVENVDIAPTIADLAGIHWGADGMSLVPLLDGQVTSLRDDLLLEACQGIKHEQGKTCGQESYKVQTVPPDSVGVVTPDYKYVEYGTGEEELYDLSADPYELFNHAGDPAWADLQSQLAAQLAALLAPPVTDTTIVTGPHGQVTGSLFTFTYFSQSRFAAYQCRVSAIGTPGRWGACGNQTTTIGPLAPGDYRFSVRGTDQGAVTDPTPASRSFTVVDDERQVQRPSTG